jgi:hypothetical protein
MDRSRWGADEEGLPPGCLHLARWAARGGPSEAEAAFADLFGRIGWKPTFTPDLCTR